MSATRKFKTEVADLLHLIIHSLYSNKEIFLRELISNASDAIDKLRYLTLTDESLKGFAFDPRIDITFTEGTGRTLTISDNGIGMDEDDLNNNLGTIASSGTKKFLASLSEDQKKDSNLIGQFGVGFYSAFMVASRITVISRKAGSDKAYKWTSTGESSYSIEEAERDGQGTTIILTLNEEGEQFANRWTLENLIKKYSDNIAYPIFLTYDQTHYDNEKKDANGEPVKTVERKTEQINSASALWKRSKSGIKDEEYKEFYKNTFYDSEDPLFYIHMNIDYPFNLTGILYFPKIRNNFEIQKNKIQLYCNQVFVTDQVEGIVPEYLTLLHGVIDSPDIPLNVSRSYLQSDSNVKKISSYITRKVADRLKELFTTMRADYEKKWDDLKIFIEYGILTDDKFAEKAEDFMLLKSTSGKYFTAKEYVDLVKENQTDKNNTVILLYVDDPVEKHSFLESAKSKGYDVLEMNGPLDSHYINWYESKNQNVRFERVDSDVIEKLIQKGDQVSMSLTEAQQEIMRPVFESQLPKDDKITYNIAFEAMAADEAPVVITQNEFMRRMKDMARVSGGGMSQFYGQMPDNFTIAVNGNHPIVIDILGKVEKEYGDKLKTITKKIDAAVAEEKRFEETVKDKKEADLTPEEKSMREELSKKVVTLRDERNERLREIGKGSDLVRQIIDLALLSNGMLKGKNLSDFIQRSISLIEK